MDPGSRIARFPLVDRVRRNAHDAQYNSASRTSKEKQIVTTMDGVVINQGFCS